MKNNFLSLFLGCSFFLSQWAWAQTMGFYVRDQVKVLPKSRFIVSVVGFQSNINSQLDRSGQETSIQDKLNRTITFKDITKDDPLRTNQLVGLLDANDVNQNLDAGFIQGRVKGFVDGQIPLIGYGLTDNTMIIVAMPILHFRIQAQHQFVKSQSTENFLNSLKSQDQSSTAQDFESAFDTSLENKLYRSGYSWNPDVDKKLVGDIQLTVMNQLTSSQSAFSVGLILPTATTASMDDLYQLSGGEKKWAISVKYVKLLQLNQGLSLTNSLENSVYLPTRQWRRLYTDADSELKEGFDQTEISAVNQIKYQMQLRYEFPKWFGITGGFNWQYRTGEKLSGDKYDQTIYEFNSRGTDQELKSAQLAVDINSINSFLQGQFLLPMAFELSTFYTLGGRNVLSEPVYQAQGSLFF
jgi:hypothetical protein